MFVALAPVPLLHRVTSIVDLRDTSNYDRLCMLEAGVTMVRERPVFGLGPDLVKRRYPIYRPPAAPRYEVPHLHNSLLQLAAERGLPALASYLGLTAAAVVAPGAGSSARGRARARGPTSTWDAHARPPRLQPGRAVREQLGRYRGAAAGPLPAGASPSVSTPRGAQARNGPRRISDI